MRKQGSWTKNSPEKPIQNLRQIIKIKVDQRSKRVSVKKRFFEEGKYKHEDEVHRVLFRQPNIS